MFKKRFFFTTFLCFIFLISTVNANENHKTYINKKLKVSFKYNKEWVRNPAYNERYEGDSGYFEVNALDGKTMNLDQAAKHIANHKLKPYGINPIIKNLTIHGQKAKLILPSDDQSPYEKNLSTIIIKYPFGRVVLNGDSYSYFLLSADKSNILDISKTISFIH